MNLSINFHVANGKNALRRQQGMTLVEAMIAAALMVMVIGGLMSANFLGMRQDQLTESMAGANDTSRNAVNTMLSDIRLAKGYYIGTYDGTNFTACSAGTAQQGVALMLYPVVNSTNQAVDTSQYILYYFDLSDAANSDGHLLRTYNVSGSPVSTAMVASNLINSLYFTSENYYGLTQSNRTYKGVIHTTLQFCEFQYPLTQVGSNCLFQYYRMDCRATPHLPDGP